MAEQPTHGTATRIVVVGGVAGGASAATRARRTDASAVITLIEKGPAVSFANCGLPYHVGGEIADRDDLLVATPELFRDRFGIEVRTETEAIAIDRDSKSVTLRRPDGSRERLPYDKLILATGAEPIIPDFARGDFSNAGTLWSLGDMDHLLESVAGRPGGRVAVIGGGFVGLEMAEQLIRRGHPCTLVERGGQVLFTLDPEMALPLQQELLEKGVDLRLGVSVSRLVVDEASAGGTGARGTGARVTGIEIDGEALPVDYVVLAIGVRPRTELARAAGLEIGESGGVRVDDRMRTADPDIFAVGDCVEYPHAVLGRPTRVPLAGPANRAGRIAGTVAAGGEAAPMGPVCGTNVIRVFGKAAAGTGLSESQCRREGIACRSVFIQASNHASYFPGAESLLLKLIYAADGKILGAQAVGGEGVDKRIDVIATAIHFGGTVYDLAGLDLAYAPPFGSAKDPVHMAAFVACNDLESHPAVAAPDSELGRLQVVDVRTAGELERLPLPDAIHLPIDELPRRLAELDPGRETVTVCYSGKRAHVAACLLKNSGFRQVRNLTGGMLVRGQMGPCGD